jgi:hypothetical protein
MSYQRASQVFDSPGLYVISVQGRVAADASAYLNDLTIAHQEEGGQYVSILSGELLDQAALIGVLNTLYERGYVVLAVNRIALG